MKILILWDVYWRIWRAALKKELPLLKDKYKPDFVVVNIENSTSWRWPIEKHALELEALWIDVMTWWDHCFDNIDRIKDYLNSDNSKLIRPANFYEQDDYKLPGRWFKIVENNWKKLLVIHLLWEVFMNHRVDNPFIKIDKILENLDVDVDWIIVDFHKEATAEIQWLWFHLDWRVWFVFWTHTHVQTNDEIILPKWTWLISDVWMNWPLYSVIWAEFDSVRKRFLTWISRWKISQQLEKDYLINWVIVELKNDKMCNSIEKIKIKGSL